MRLDPLARRDVLRGLSLGAAAFTVPGLFAQQLAETTRLGEGPFYPDKLPLDTDNDLILINERATPALGEITHLTGRLLTSAGSPVRNAFIEIWQADQGGSYIHSGGENTGGRDRNFQGYGRFLTDSKGQYYFRTIKPVSYTLQGMFRAPHIHFAVSRNGRRMFVTQAMVKGHPDNPRDSITGRLSPEAMQSILVDFQPLPGSRIGELAANFDIVLGRTAQEDENGRITGGIGPAENRNNGKR
jgi:protocatechuate 3,4-dioxygenase beta subunit